MNKQQIETRIEQLTEMELQVQQRATAELQAIAGAKQDCQYWLGQMNTAPAEAPAEAAPALRELSISEISALTASKLKPGRKKKTE